MAILLQGDDVANFAAKINATSRILGEYARTVSEIADAFAGGDLSPEGANAMRRDGRALLESLYVLDFQLQTLRAEMARIANLTWAIKPEGSA